MIQLIITVVVFLGLLIGTITDLKTREVPDWVNFSLIALGFSINLLGSVIYGSLTFIVSSIVGFLLCLILALIMFYTGQWGGGDSKMIMALGALLGLNIRSLNWTGFSLISFLANILAAGAIYGILWSVYLSYMHRKKFFAELKVLFNRRKSLNILALIAFVLLVAALLSTRSAIMTLNIFALLALLILYFLWMYVKVVEKTCMIRSINPKKLTEGDWIVKEIKVNGKYITGPKELGITKPQIKKILSYYRLGKIRQVLIKEGIPFVPSFLIAFIITAIFGNTLYLIYNIL